MAPEQVAGEQADARADNFAFGAVLYELLTGKRAFQGPNSASIIGAVMKDDPLAIGPLPQSVPPAVPKLLNRCLAKDRERRYQSARSVAFDLEEAAFPPTAPAASRRNFLVGGSAIFATRIGLGLLRSRPAATSAPSSYHLTIEPPPGHRFPENPLMSLSPDGRTAQFTVIDEQQNGQRWLHSVIDGVARPLPKESETWLTRACPVSRFFHRRRTRY